MFGPRCICLYQCVCSELSYLSSSTTRVAFGSVCFVNSITLSSVATLFVYVHRGVHVGNSLQLSSPLALDPVVHSWFHNSLEVLCIVLRGNALVCSSNCLVLKHTTCLHERSCTQVSFRDCQGTCSFVPRVPSYTCNTHVCSVHAVLLFSCTVI